MYRCNWICGGEYIKENIIGNYFKRYDDDIYKACDDILEILGSDKEW